MRLASSADTLGIAEGVETAMSAAQLFEVPVWAALSSGGLIKWRPPSTVRNVIVFGDNDSSFAGQAAAFALAHKLRIEGLHVDVRIPDEEGDWNDVVAGERNDANADKAAGSVGVQQGGAYAWPDATVHNLMGA